MQAVSQYEKNQLVNILLAEDDDSMRSFMAETLEKDGYRVTQFSDGTDLDTWLETHRDTGIVAGEQRILISDIFMPGATALNILEWHQDTLHNLPIILITGFGSENLHARAMRMGATLVLNKPFTVIDLRRALSELITE